MRHLLIASLFFAVPAFAKPVEFKLDKAHSTIGFTARHLAISKVPGTFGAFKVKATADDKTGHVSKIAVIIEVASIETGIGKRDMHLRATDFFDAKRFPKAVFTSTDVSVKGDEVVAIGTLLIKGVEKKVTFKGEFLGARSIDFGSGAKTRAGYSLSAAINRKDFGLNFNRLINGTAVVSDRVKITVDLEIISP
jgi:polyisoprenoid-binding protein YceI